jgi:DNA-binding MarR family transcriptional regulator
VTLPVRAPRPALRPRKRKATPPAGDGEAVYSALQYLLRSFQSRDRDRPCYFDVSISECHALEAIVRAGPIGINDLAAALRLDKSGASRLARSLEEKGYVTRGAHPGDGRALALTATPGGNRLERRIQESIADRYAAALRAFPPRLRRSLPDALRALADAAARPRGPGTRKAPAR